ncbi:MAG TPA: hypothetical protein VI488_20045 [Candidatus Angelobacter sp.]
MVKKIFCTLALVAALLLVFSGLAAAQAPGQNKGPTIPLVLTTLPQVGPLAPVGTEEPCIANPCLFYAGDFDAAGPNPNGLFSGIDNFFGLTLDATVWVPFNVPKKFKGAKGKTDWSITGLFGNTQDINNPASETTANWSIVQGVVAGSPVSSATVICSATNSPMTTTPTGRIAFGDVEYTDVVTVSGCPILEAGTYWMAVVPIDLTNPAGFQETFLSDVEDSTPKNAEGPGTEPVDQSYFTSTFFGFPNFTLANSASVCGGIGCDSFSVGVIGTAVH